MNKKDSIIRCFIISLLTILLVCALLYCIFYTPQGIEPIPNLSITVDEPLSMFHTNTYFKRTAKPALEKPAFEQVEVEVEPEKEPSPEPSVEPSEPSYAILEDERYIMTCIIAGESNGSSMEFKMAVAQTIYTAMENAGCGVEGIRWRYDGYCDKGYISDEEWQRCEEAVSRVFDNGERVVDAPIEFFYNPSYCTSEWHETLTYVTTIDGCRFFCR